MPEINPDDANIESRALAMLQAIQKHHALVKANRFLAILVLVLTVAVFVLGLTLLPKYNFVDEVKSQQAVSAAMALQNPAISAEINALKGQMFGLVSGSIESKLRSLEENIKHGSMAESLNTIQDLKSDVRVLSAYNTGPQLKSREDAVNQQLIKELTDLKDLVYLTFISCGLMIAAVAGIWFRHRYRLTHQKNNTIFLGRSQKN